MLVERNIHPSQPQRPAGGEPVAVEPRTPTLLANRRSPTLPAVRNKHGEEQVVRRRDLDVLGVAVEYRDQAAAELDHRCVIGDVGGDCFVRC